ncbi:TIGR02530 family flagellar biosynthesis protein [Paenibacillus sp. HB172176]|uniref:TIGR02530 family flagellar biosynthesis protein n=1 Tax=Paenibacillus sp. HB172176 TaxID=2493690 RepID=UPI0014391CA2|nr:TIGR02530 family flagellar biosynthesis protein [Paenibacillus sp. HB172176]
MSDGMKISHMYPIRSAPLQLEKFVHSDLKKAAKDSPFQKMLQSEVLNFSRHAETRMAERGIQLQPESLDKIRDAVDQAASKGAKDSLIVYRDIAMIVNVPSRTVVTAMDGNQMKSNVFTKIDSAIILS